MSGQDWSSDIVSASVTTFHRQMGCGAIHRMTKQGRTLELRKRYMIIDILAFLAKRFFGAKLRGSYEPTGPRQMGTLLHGCATHPQVIQGAGPSEPSPSPNKTTRNPEKRTTHTPTPSKSSPTFSATRHLPHKKLGILLYTIPAFPYQKKNGSKCYLGSQHHDPSPYPCRRTTRQRIQTPKDCPKFRVSELTYPQPTTPNDCSPSRQKIVCMRMRPLRVF